MGGRGRNKRKSIDFGQYLDEPVGESRALLRPPAEERKERKEMNEEAARGAGGCGVAPKGALKELGSCRSGLGALRKVLGVFQEDLGGIRGGLGVFKKVLGYSRRI